MEVRCIKDLNNGIVLNIKFMISLFVAVAEEH